MKVTVSTLPLEVITTHTLIVIHRRDALLGESMNEDLSAHLKAWKSAVEKRESRAEWFCTLPEDSGVMTRHLLLESETFGPWMPGNEQLKAVAARAVALCRKHDIYKLAFAVHSDNAPAIARHLLEGAMIGDFRDKRFKSAPEKVDPLQLTFVVRESDDKAVRGALKNHQPVVEATNYARQLVNAPNNIMTFAAIAKEARRMAKKHDMQCVILGQKELESEGYGLILGVGRASEHPPRLIVLRHKPRNPRTKQHIALVGKGVMFDTGGYCIKTSGAMHTMNADMAGAAAVLAAMQAIAILKLPIRVTAIIPAAVNAIDAAATLPGAILTSRSGRTVYVENTDAEGRLLLADAYTRAAEEKADTIIDIATLTGSAKQALGPAIAALFTDDEELNASLTRAGEASGDFLWRMPIWREYAPAMEHQLADMTNRSPYLEGGAIHAANFLKAFIPPDTRWAHIDIAPCAKASKVTRYYSNDTPTGVGVRLFLEWLHGQIENQ